MKTRTNQPVFLDNGNKVDDAQLGGTKLYNHKIVMVGTDSNTSDDVNYNITLISTKQHFDFTTDISSPNGDYVACLFCEETESGSQYDVFRLDYQYHTDSEEGTLSIIGYSGDLDEITSADATILSLTDTVTPL